MEGEHEEEIRMATHCLVTFGKLLNPTSPPTGLLFPYWKLERPLQPPKEAPSIVPLSGTMTLDHL